MKLSDSHHSCRRQDSRFPSHRRHWPRLEIIISLSDCFTLLLTYTSPGQVNQNIDWNFLFSISPISDSISGGGWQTVESAVAEQPCMVCRLVVFVQILLAIQHSTSDIRPAVSLACCGVGMWLCYYYKWTVFKPKRNSWSSRERP